MLEQAIFGAYEIFANIIPGSILLITSVLLFYPSLLTEVPESFLFLLLIFLSFVFVFAIQGLSSILERMINKRKYGGGYPSKLYLKDDDETFPKYFKKAIREIANKEFGTPLDASSQHVWDFCYISVIKNGSQRVSTFVYNYTFARNMTVAAILEFVVCTVGAFLYGQTSIFLAGIVALASSYLFYKRFMSYGKSFAKEVLRSFFIDRLSRRTRDDASSSPRHRTVSDRKRSYDETS